MFVRHLTRRCRDNHFNFKMLTHSRCDLSRPCQTCRDRDHPELCSYHPPSKRQNLGQSSDGGGFTSSFKVEEVPQNPGGFVSLGNREFDFLCRKLTVLENSITDLKREMKRNANGRSPFMDGDASGGSNIDPAVDGRLQRPTHADVHGVHIKNDAVSPTASQFCDSEFDKWQGEVVHVGAGSIPAMFYAMQMDQGGNEQNKVQEMLSRTVLPLFGLDNESATYPFVDLWGLPHGSRTRAQELAKALPTDQQMWHFFRCYKEMGYVIYAGLASLDGLETQISELLTNRARAMLEETDDAVTEQLIYGKSLNWLALIFATLASGAQCSEMPRKERELTSQVYSECSKRLRSVPILTFQSLLQFRMSTLHQLLVSVYAREHPIPSSDRQRDDQQSQRWYIMVSSRTHN